MRAPRRRTASESSVRGGAALRRRAGLGYPRIRFHGLRLRELVERHLLQRASLRAREPELERRALGVAERARVAARQRAEDHERLEVVAVGAAVIVVVGP